MTPLTLREGHLPPVHRAHLTQPQRERCAHEERHGRKCQQRHRYAQRPGRADERGAGSGQSSSHATTANATAAGATRTVDTPRRAPRCPRRP
ncbi:MAG: hypothetical protein R2854_10455 [Caldilineaceae bacterium]